MSTPSTKCPKCGSVAIKTFDGLIEFACRSTIEGVYSRFIQTTICERKVELTTLRTSLDKAKEALRPFGKWGAYIGDGGYFSGDLVFMTATSDGELKVTLDDLRRASAVLKEIEIV